MNRRPIAVRLTSDVSFLMVSPGISTVRSTWIHTFSCGNRLSCRPKRTAILSVRPCAQPTVREKRGCLFIVLDFWCKESQKASRCGEEECVGNATKGRGKEGGRQKCLPPNRKLSARCLRIVAKRIEDAHAAEGAVPADGLHDVGVVLFVGSLQSHQVALSIPT